MAPIIFLRRSSGQSPIRIRGLAHWQLSSGAVQKNKWRLSRHNTGAFGAEKIRPANERASNCRQLSAITKGMSFWAVAQTESLRERTAQRWLDAEFQTYLPVIRSATDRFVPLFPSYLFVKVGEIGWSRINSSVGIVQMLLAGDQPAKLKDSIIAELKGRERNGVVRLPKPQPFRIGDKVRVIHGSFVDLVGLYDGMSMRDRQFVLLELLGRKVRVEIEKSDLRIV